jgi:basic membrane protein A
VVSLLAVAGLVLAACSDAPDESTDNGTTDAATETSGAATSEAASDFFACMVSDEGGFDDQSFNQSTYEGLQRAGVDLGIEVLALESHDSNDYAPNLEDMVAKGCDITITVGFNLSEGTKTAAEANPSLNYAIVDDSQISLPNVKPIVYATQEAAFLAGYVAAAYSTTGKVGTFGGAKIPTVTIFMDGFADGVARYNQDKGGNVELLGWDKATQNGLFTDDFTDQAKGKTTALNLIAQGADVIMPVAGPVGLGAAQAAQEDGNTVIIWVDADGYLTTEYGSIILTSVMKLMGEAVENVITDTKDGNFSPDPYVGNLANGGVAIAPFHDFTSQVSDETKAEVAALEAAIQSGELKVESDSAP